MCLRAYEFVALALLSRTTSVFLLQNSFEVGELVFRALGFLGFLVGGRWVKVFVGSGQGSSFWGFLGFGDWGYKGFGFNGLKGFWARVLGFKVQVRFLGIAKVRRSANHHIWLAKITSVHGREPTDGLEHRMQPQKLIPNKPYKHMMI